MNDREILLAIYDRSSDRVHNASTAAERDAAKSLRDALWTKLIVVASKI